MSLSVTALLTDVARQRIAQYSISGKAYQVVDFSVNSFGHDLGDPTLALPSDRSAVVCPGGTPLFGPEPIYSSVLISDFCPQFLCVLEKIESNGSLSNICLIATVVYSPIGGDVEVGTSFLYAVGNFPLKIKTGADRMLINVNVQF